MLLAVETDSVSKDDFLRSAFFVRYSLSTAFAAQRKQSKRIVA